jgi:MFS family permease
VALFPAINAERFGGDPRTLGLFTTAIGLGGLASAAFSGLVTHVSRQGRAMLCAVAAWGAALTGFALAPSLWLTLSLLAIAGAADTFTVVFRGAIIAAATPDHLRGRVMAADYVIGAFYLFGPRTQSLYSFYFVILWLPLYLVNARGFIEVDPPPCVVDASAQFVELRFRNIYAQRTNPTLVGRQFLEHSRNWGC